MTAREYLEQARRLYETIESLKEELRMIRTESGGGGMGSGAGMPRWNGETGEIKRANRAIDLERKINQEIAIKTALLYEIHDVIGAVADPDEKLVLRYRYIHTMTWGKIAKKLHMSESKARRTWETALDHVVIPSLKNGGNEQK